MLYILAVHYAAMRLVDRGMRGGSLQRSKETEGGDENKDGVLRERIQTEKGEMKGRIRKSRGKGRRWGKGAKEGKWGGAAKRSIIRSLFIREI
jgi:hypothetical protein